MSIFSQSAYSEPKPTNNENVQFTTLNGDFIDQYGRTRYFKGINLSGSSKLPSTSNCKDESNTLCSQVSFVGRPFPLAKADEHFARLQQWGFNFVRLVTTWEAIEHVGPKQYDHEYIAYIKQLVQLADKFQLTVMIDPHQDVWSRFTGGDGAPLWTLEKVGFNPAHFNQTNAALVLPQNPDLEYPPMIWPTNYAKLASATMFTLFFAGDDFAPNTYIDKIPVQQYLQQHYINAFQQLAQALKDEPNVIGFEVMNEPHPGFIGQKNLNKYTAFPLRNQATPTPAQAMKIAAGNTVTVANWQVGLLGLEQDGQIEINKQRLSAWQTPEKDVWRQNEVWQYNHDKFEITKQDYFSVVDGKLVEFSNDYYAPFIRKFSQAIREELPTSLIFIEKPFNAGMPHLPKMKNIVNATHWYDQITLIKKLYLSWVTLDLASGAPVFGDSDITQLFKTKLNKIKSLGPKLNVNAPTLVGEFGIPFDLSDKSAYSKTWLGEWDFSEQNYALDRSFKALDNNQLNYALWNYTPENNNQQGDLWNGEDLSIFSLSQQQVDSKGIDNGGRALRAVTRPFASSVSGKVDRTEFDINTGKYQLIISGKALALPTEIILPPYYYDQGINYELSDGELTQTDNPLIWHYTPANTATSESNLHKLVIEPKIPPSSIDKFNALWWLVIVLIVGYWLKRKYR